MKNLKEHWEGVYGDPTRNEFTWTQKEPTQMLALLQRINPDLNLPVIDVGGGDSLLVDHLIALGFKDITVLDISGNAITRAKKRLGEKASKVKWVISDIADFKSEKKYNVWIDRATFHFAVSKLDREKYLEIVQQNTNSKSNLLISTFSDNGPQKCSGLEVKQYNRYSLTDEFKDSFDRTYSCRELHYTPHGETQEFIYVTFEKRNQLENPNHSIEEEEYFDTKPNFNESEGFQSCSVDKKCCC